VRYTIDPRASRLSAKAFAGGMLASLGHNPTLAIRDFAGEAEFDPETPATAAVRVTVKATSLEVTGNMSSSDQKEILQKVNDEVLETARYPEIVYDCPASRVSIKPTGAGQLEVSLNGNLTLHGVTRSQPMLVRVSADGDTIRGYGEATLRQSEFGLKQVTAAGSMMKVKDEVKLSLEIVARKNGA
jgi:polyisoprenoid-binding protein YceI